MLAGSNLLFLRSSGQDERRFSADNSMRIRRCMLPVLAAVSASLLLACERIPHDEPQAPPNRPVDAVLEPAAAFRVNDLNGLVRVAVPPDLLAQLDAAWMEGRTRWPLEELPLHEQLPRLLAALSAEDAEETLERGFQQQLVGAERDLRLTIEALTEFGAQYLLHEPSLDDQQRERAIQWLLALGQWGQQAPLTDPQRARLAIARLTEAARQTGLYSEADFAALGRERTLQRLSEFLAVAKQVLAEYGFDLDQTVDSLDVALAWQTGDTAELRLRYDMAGTPVDVTVPVERIDGRWYRVDYLRHLQETNSRPAQELPGASDSETPDVV